MLFQTHETFRFEDENDTNTIFNLVFSRILKKQTCTPESYIVLFVIREDSTVIYIEGG